MSEEKLPESFYREIFRHTKAALMVVNGLMKSDDEEIQVYAVRAFITFSELAIALAEGLGEKSERYRNPLSRRYIAHRYRGRGGHLK